MIIVSDCGPLAYLVSLGIADFLPQLYGDVHIPPAVLAELCHPNCPVVGWANQLPGWIHVTTPSSTYDELSLGIGEREAIALALELGANRVLMDEKRGRQAAQTAGLRVAGTLAVIVDGANKGFFDGNEAIEKLAGTTFYATPELLEQVRTLLNASLP